MTKLANTDPKPVFPAQTADNSASQAVEQQLRKVREPPDNNTRTTLVSAVSRRVHAEQSLTLLSFSANRQYVPQPVGESKLNKAQSGRGNITY